MAAKIISETPITMIELKEDLKKIKDRDKELNFRAQKTEEYLKIFVGLKPEHAKDIRDKIEKLNIPRLKADHITKIIDVLPQTLEEAKLVLSAYPITVTNENLKKIAEVVSPFIDLDRKEVKKQEAQREKEAAAAEKAAEAEKAKAASAEEAKKESEESSEEPEEEKEAEEDGSKGE